MVRERLVLRDGKFEHVEQSVELLPDQLRQLPSELVTKHIEEQEKAHALDPRHHINMVKRMRRKAEKADRSPSDKKWDAVLRDLVGNHAVDAVLPLSQYRIDILKAKLQMQLLRNAAIEIGQGKTTLSAIEKFVGHLIFPENNCFNMVFLPSPQPPNKLLPKHLRHYNLEVRLLGDLPRAFLEELKNRGIDAPDIRSTYENFKKEVDRKRKRTEQAFAIAAELDGN